jgi:hypothetical protein
VLEKKINIDPVPPAGLLRSEIAQLEARYDSGTTLPGREPGFRTTLKFRTTQLRRRG